MFEKRQSLSPTSIIMKVKSANIKYGGKNIKYLNDLNE